MYGVCGAVPDVPGLGVRSVREFPEWILRLDEWIWLLDFRLATGWPDDMRRAGHGMDESLLSHRGMRVRLAPASYAAIRTASAAIATITSFSAVATDAAGSAAALQQCQRVCAKFRVYGDGLPEYCDVLLIPTVGDGPNMRCKCPDECVQHGDATQSIRLLCERKCRHEWHDMRRDCVGHVEHVQCYNQLHRL